jgi:hypothetical protein
MRAIYCDACVRARGGPERIGEERTSAVLHGRCTDCRAAFCLFCRSAEDARTHRGCSMHGASAFVHRLRIFDVSERPDEAPTLRALPEDP